MKITLFGAGYVGLVTAACFAEVGNEVVCVDVNAERIAQLNAGQCPIHEPDLPEMLLRHTQSGRLKFTTSAAAGIEHGAVIFIAVGTPQDQDGSADLRYVLAVAKSIGEHLQDYRVVITKSTVPVGTADQVKATIMQELERRNCHVDFQVVSNPEFLREGAAVSDFMNSDRIIIGTEDPQAAVILNTLYAPFNRNHDRLMQMDIRSAELAKYAANAMLATRISFMNEMSLLAERLGADIEQVRIGIGSDPRIGYHFLNPGCGYGGSCFPKDVRALERMAETVNFDAKIIKAIDEINQRQKTILFNKIQTYFKNDLSNKTIAVWGLAFKPNTDDMREASSVSLCEALWEAGAKVQAFDPAALGEAQKLFGNRSDLQLCSSAEEALRGADALAIVTEWRIFLSPDFTKLKQLLNQPVIFDGRNIYDPMEMQRLGFRYFAMGRGEKL